MMSGAAKTKTELAELTGNSTAYMSMIASLCTLSPDIVDGICSGEIHVTLETLKKIKTPIWSEQHRLLGLD